MDAQDEATVRALWRTSTPEARARYLRNEPAYDAAPTPHRAPRDYVASCVVCGAPFVVVAAPGAAHRAYCRRACSALAYYRRHRAGRVAYQRVYRARTRPEAA